MHTITREIYLRGTPYRRGTSGAGGLERAMAGKSHAILCTYANAWKSQKRKTNEKNQKADKISENENQ